MIHIVFERIDDYFQGEVPLNTPLVAYKDSSLTLPHMWLPDADDYVYIRRNKGDFLGTFTEVFNDKPGSKKWKWSFIDTSQNITEDNLKELL